MATETYHVNGVSVEKYTPAEPSKKAPIIMIHGGNGAGWSWEIWAKQFCEAGYEIHVPDWYNHGKSDDLPEQEYLHRSIGDVADKEIKYVAEKLQRTPIVIGHSMGGLVAAAYATKAPIEKLVLVAPVMPHAVHPEPMAVPVDMTRPFPAFPYEQAKQLFFTTMSDEDARRYYELLEPESPQAVHETTQWSLEVDPAAIDAPTLVVSAELDQIMKPEPLKRYAELLHADFMSIAGVGHSDVVLKLPETQQAAEQVLDWLSN